MTNGTMMDRARPFLLILDRDGTIIEDKGYLCDPKQIALENGAIEGLAALIAQGAVPVIVTNQSGVGRGYFSMDDVDAVHGALTSILTDHGISIAAFYVCPHHPDERCTCRKPNPSLGLQAAAELSLPLETAVVVGDKLSDVDFASQLGALGVLIRTGEGRLHEAAARAKGHPIVDSLLELSKILDQRDRKHRCTLA